MAANTTKPVIDEPTPETVQEHKTVDPMDRYTINGVKPINSDSLKSSEVNGCESTGRNTLWKQGVSGNPKGRPKGSLNKISSLFYDDLYADWVDHGNQVIADMRLDSPTKYAQLVASILPKTLNVDDTGNVTWVINATPNLSTSEWQAAHGLIESQPIDIEED